MNFIIETKTLKKVLKNLNLFIEKKPIIKALGEFKVIADNEKQEVTFFATNLERGITITEKTIVQHEGIVLIKFKPFANFIKTLKTPQVILDITREELKVNGINLGNLAERDYNEFPENFPTGIGMIEQGFETKEIFPVLEKMIKGGIWNQKINTHTGGREILNHINFKVNEYNLLEITVCGGNFLMNRKKLPLIEKDTRLNYEFNLDPYTMKVVYEIAKREEEVSFFAKYETESKDNWNSVIFKTGNTEIFCRKEQGKYPNYDIILQGRREYGDERFSYGIDTEKMLQICNILNSQNNVKERDYPSQNEDYNLIKTKNTEGELTVTDRYGNNLYYSQKIYNTSDFIFWFSPFLLEGILKIIGSDLVYLSYYGYDKNETEYNLSNQHLPFFLEDKTNSYNITYVIMPVRIKSE